MSLCANLRCNLSCKSFWMQKPRMQRVLQAPQASRARSPALLSPHQHSSPEVSQLGKLEQKVKMLTPSDFLQLGGSSLQAVHGPGAGRKGSSGRLERSTDTKQGGGKYFHTISEPILAQTGRVRIVICHKMFIFKFSPVKLPAYKACFVQTGLEENATVCFYANIVSTFSVTVFGSHHLFKYEPFIQRQSHIRTLQTAVSPNGDEAQHYVSVAENQNTEVPKVPDFLESTAVQFKNLWHHCHFP